MTLTYDLFWSFRSPYSSLVTPRLLEFERDFDVKVNVRRVDPIAVRIDGFIKTVNPLWWGYLRRDVARTAEMLGLPYSAPKPDPIVMELESGEVSREQPYMGCLTRLGVAAAEPSNGLAFLKEVSAVIFGGARNWHLADHLARVVARSGLDLAELDHAMRRVRIATR